MSDGLARSALASDDTLWAWKRGGRGGKRGGRQRRQVAAAHWLPLSNAGVKTTTHEVTYFLSPSNKLYIQHFGPALANRLAPFSLSKGASCNSELQRQNAERLFRAISWLGIEILTSRRRDLFAEEKLKKREEKKKSNIGNVGQNWYNSCHVNLPTYNKLAQRNVCSRLEGMPWKTDL